MFSTFPETNFHCSVTLILTFADGINMDQHEILSFGKELSHFQHCFSYTAAISASIHDLLKFLQPFPKQQISDSSNLKEFADDNFRLNDNG